jgi:hypothetical protein
LTEVVAVPVQICTVELGRFAPISDLRLRGNSDKKQKSGQVKTLFHLRRSSKVVVK